jgi:hypothetical protein
MARSTLSRGVVPVAAAIVLVAAVAVIATGALGQATPAPRPTAIPSSAPTVIPSLVPTPEPSPVVQPSSQPSSGLVVVPLRNLTENDVKLSIDDDTDALVSAVSGTPGDGMSVRWFDVAVENIDAQTLRVTWVGLPRDEQVDLDVTRVDGKLRLRFVQAAPPANSDALGFDRVLHLTFDSPVRSEDVLATIQEGLDTAG